jgi:hypothetical protein
LRNRLSGHTFSDIPKEFSDFTVEESGKGGSMAQATNIYGEVGNKADLDRIFREIRRDVAEAKSRAGLTELHKRAGYLITLTHAPSWQEKFGADAKSLREEAKKEFTATARKINARAREIGTEADYDESWGER